MTVLNVQGEPKLRGRSGWSRKRPGSSCIHSRKRNDSCILYPFVLRKKTAITLWGHLWMELSLTVCSAVSRSPEYNSFIWDDPFKIIKVQLAELSSINASSLDFHPPLWNGAISKHLCHSWLVWFYPSVCIHDIFVHMNIVNAVFMCLSLPYPPLGRYGGLLTCGCLLNPLLPLKQHKALSPLMWMMMYEETE